MGWEETMIQVVGVNKDKIREKGSNEARGLWILPLKLSAKPEEGWLKQFYAAHARNPNPKKGSVEFVNDYLEVSFSESDDLQKTVDLVNVSVKAANEAHKEVYLKKAREQQEILDYRNKQLQTLERLRIDADRLKF